MANSQDIWADIRVTSEKLSDLSVRLREAASEARTAAQVHKDSNSPLHFELLQNLKKLADQIREILWRELRNSSDPLSSLQSKNRAAELFTLLARIAASRQGESTPRSFFEEIEDTVDRTLGRTNPPDDPNPEQDSKIRAA